VAAVVFDAVSAMNAYWRMLMYQCKIYQSKIGSIPGLFVRHFLKKAEQNQSRRSSAVEEL
jgi:hypothetical protein